MILISESILHEERNNINNWKSSIFNEIRCPDKVNDWLANLAHDRMHDNLLIIFNLKRII